jgi:2-polyprenyl-6-methoxyphenol hydroxylase-like FAD-dependent oxidoreductase
MENPVVIAGAGPGGLALALALHQRGLPVLVCEAVPDLKPLGVGINVLPHAVRVLHRLGLGADLARIAIATAELRYYTRRGQLIWAEPRGLDAGYSYPQYSVHRGQLQLLLYATAIARLGPERVRTGLALSAWRDEGAGVSVTLRGRDGEVVEVSGACLVAADGIHSAARRALFPDEGPPRHAGRILWRAVTPAMPFLGGRTMIMAGHQDQKFVCYPIGPTAADGRAPLNWIAELTVPDWTPPPQDWNRRVPTARFRERFADWRFDWLDIPALIDGAAAVYEYPLVDRDPLPRWTHGRMTLLGDAAHPMYPVGSNGASQAILDAEALADALVAGGEVGDALVTYEAARRPATAQITLLNRANGPEQVMQLAEERAPEGFGHIDEVIPRDELEAIAARYKQAAGFTIEQVNRR